MDISGKLFARWSALAVVALTSIGCQLPSQPVVTVWQKLGIPQAAIRARDSLTNRRGNHPELEREPPLLRIADPANLLSENPAIKAAAEIKMQEDMKEQKLKALKYLATIGCGCYDKDGKIEEALLAALADCTEEVRIQAAETVAEAAGTCKCKYDGCSPTCCTPAIVKRLYDMAYEVDEDGCPIEPSPAVRRAAARAVSACSAVPQPLPEAVDEGQDDDGEALPEPPPEPEPTEALPAPGAIEAGVNLNAPEETTVSYEQLNSIMDHQVPPAAIEASTVAATEAETVTIVSDQPSEALDYWGESPESSTPASAVQAVTAPEDMVTGLVVGSPASGTAVLRLDSEYDILPGDKLLLLSVEGHSAVAEIASVDGAMVEVGTKDLATLRLAANAHVFVGLVAR